MKDEADFPLDRGKARETRSKRGDAGRGGEIQLNRRALKGGERSFHSIPRRRPRVALGTSAPTLMIREKKKGRGRKIRLCFLAGKKAKKGKKGN